MAFRKKDSDLTDIIAGDSQACRTETNSLRKVISDYENRLTVKARCQPLQIVPFRIGSRSVVCVQNDFANPYIQNWNFRSKGSSRKVYFGCSIRRQQGNEAVANGRR